MKSKVIAILATMFVLTGCVKNTTSIETVTTTEEVTAVEDKSTIVEDIISEIEETTESEVMTEETVISELIYDSYDGPEHIAYYEDSKTAYTLIPYDERGSLDYNVRDMLFEQYGDALNSISKSLLDITGDGVPDFLCDFTDEEQIKYSIIDGSTFEVVPEYDVTFDFYDRGGAIIANALRRPDGSCTFLLVHRQSTLYSEDNLVYNQAKDIRGETFGFYSYMPKERERMLGSTGKKGMLYDSDSDGELRYFGDGSASVFKEKGVEGKPYIRIWGADMVQFDIRGTIWYNVYMSGNRGLTAEQVDMWMGE